MLDTYNIEESAEDEVQETEANVFASHFLMPEKAFVSEWNDTYGLSLATSCDKCDKCDKGRFSVALSHGHS